MRIARLGFRVLLASLAGSVWATLDIVPTNADAQDPIYVLKDTTTGKVYGTFWDAAKDSSDYGFESSKPPEFLWSPDRAYLAVNPGNDNARWTAPFLYRVTADSLVVVELPTLPPGSADALEAVRNGSNQLAADQTKAVRWQNNGSLLVSYFAATRQIDDANPQIEASLWADITFDGNTASVAATGPTEPAVDSSVAASVAASLPSPVKPEFQPESMAGGMRVTVQWKIGGDVAIGNGLIQDCNLAVALETITVGNPSVSVPEFPNLPVLKGRFMTEKKEVVTIAGDGEAKAITWTTDGKSEALSVLALGNGLAVRRAQGGSVFLVNTALDAPYLMGQPLIGKNTIAPENLFPAF